MSGVLVRALVSYIANVARLNNNWLMNAKKTTALNALSGLFAMRYVASMLILLLLCLPVAASEKEDVQATINSQLQAFVEDDVERAYSFASPSIRAMFGTAQLFGQMVELSYPMVWKPSGVAFLEHQETLQGRTQDVQISDAAGTAHYLRYFLTQTISGWKISGVQFLDVTDISV